jgi:hypothetical protein
MVVAVPDVDEQQDWRCQRWTASWLIKLLLSHGYAVRHAP